MIISEILALHRSVLALGDKLRSTAKAYLLLGYLPKLLILPLCYHVNTIRAYTKALLLRILRIEILISLVAVDKVAYLNQWLKRT
jgi:hypothetical protein